MGEMQFYYSDLKIGLVKNGDPDESTFMQKVLSTVANTFIIRRNNKSRRGMIYTERLDGQSFINYIVKTTFSGVMTSVGVKRNNKYKKQYQQHIRQSKLPEIGL